MIVVTLKEQYYVNDNSLKRLTMAIKRTNADIWCSKAVRLRDGACVRCGSTQAPSRSLTALLHYISAIVRFMDIVSLFSELLFA